MTGIELDVRNKRALRSVVEKYDAKRFARILEGTEHSRKFWREKDVILQHRHDFRPILHHVLENLSLTEPVGDRTHSDRTAVPTGPSPVNQPFELGRDTLSIYGSIQLEIQPESLQTRNNLPPTFDRSFQIDNNDFQDRFLLIPHSLVRF